MLRDIDVLYRQNFVDRFPHYPRRSDRRRSYGGTATERLELRVLDDAVVVYFDLEFHHVAAGGGADEAGAD